MNDRRARLATAVAAFATFAGLGAQAVTAAPASAKPATAQSHPTAHVCGTPAAGHAACAAIRRQDVNGSAAHPAKGGPPQPPPPPSGPYGPADIASAYALPGGTAGTGHTVAIVDAYDDPNAEADLAVYRSHFNLTPCTTAGGCFRKVNQRGVQGSYPSTNGGWAQEISLDLDMVSATCPNCSILLVEADSASFADLGTAVDEAAALGADSISNSYGGGDAPDSTYGHYYNHPGIAVTASTGDSGYGASFPADSQYVTAVGGTSLSPASNSRGWTETAWSGAGSGCSNYNPAIPGQSTFGTSCTRRAEADVSAVADPNTGVVVYDSLSYQGYQGWLVFGGTSASSPIIASVYALAGNVATASGPAHLYQTYSATKLNDVTSGSNGRCRNSLCNARSGWDGPTGLGTPKGTAAF